jgi:FkbM family methyltransferase
MGDQGPAEGRDMNGIGRYFARHYLARMNAQHVRRYPQVVGFAFDLITQDIHLDGRFDRDYLQFLADRIFPQLLPGGICLDIGANIGNHSLAFAPHFTHVFAFEPHPRTFRLLELNAELASNVTALNFGASDTAGVVQAAHDPLNYAASSIGKASNAGAIHVEFLLKRVDTVDEISLDAPVTFIKIDVEGHEAAALAGAEETIRSNHPLIVLEVLPNEIHAGTSMAVEVLRSYGYQYFYELCEAGWLSRLPRNVKKAARSLLTILTARRPSKAGALVKLDRLEKRSYPMLLCSIKPVELH